MGSTVELGTATANSTLQPTNTTLSSSEEELYYVPTGLVVLLSVLYGSISALSVAGNTLVIFVIIKNKGMQTVTNFYIANLAVADVLIGVFSIPFQFQAALLQRWDLPWILCPMAPFFKEITVNVSVFTLTVISIDRYLAVIYPLKPRCSRRVAHIVMAVVWTFSLGSSLPTAIVFRVRMVPDLSYPTGEKPFCYPIFPVVNAIDLGKFYRLYSVVTQYFFPLVVICYAYIRIIKRIWGNRAPGSAMSARDQMLNRNKRKVIKMLVIVVLLFVFCWMPLQTYQILSELIPSVNAYRYINIIWFCSNWLAMSNSCYNPFIYGLLNEKFKNAFRMLFSRCRCLKADGAKNASIYNEPFTNHTEVSIRTNHDLQRNLQHGGQGRECGGRDPGAVNRMSKPVDNSNRIRKYGTKVNGSENQQSFL